MRVNRDSRGVNAWQRTGEINMVESRWWPWLRCLKRIRGLGLEMSKFRRFTLNAEETVRRPDQGVELLTMLQFINEERRHNVHADC